MATLISLTNTFNFERNFAKLSCKRDSKFRWERQAILIFQNGRLLEVIKWMLISHSSRIAASLFDDSSKQTSYFAKLYVKLLETNQMDRRL